MRKRIVLIIAILTLLAASGIGHVLADPRAAGQSNTALAVAATPAAPTEWQLSNKVMAEESKNPAYTIRVTKPVLTAAHADPFNKGVNDFLTATVNDFKDGAKNALVDPNVPGSALEITYDLLSSGGGILSLRFLATSYNSGAAHPTSYSHTLTYDLNSGTVLTLAGIFKPGAKYLDVIAKYCTDDLQRRGLLNFPEGATAKPENYQNWNMERGGLLITFDDGQVGPHAQGPSDVWIPYLVLADLVQTDTLPAWWWY